MNASRLKIAIASSGLGHVARGIEAWADDLAMALYERGEDVTLFKGAGEVVHPYERVIRCLRRDSTGNRRLLRFLPRASWRCGLGSPYAVEQITFALRMLPTLRRERVDVLHVQDPQVAVVMQWARRYGLVRTCTVLAHGTEEPPAFLQAIDHLQHLAPWHLEQTRLSGAWKPGWTAIPNFIDTRRFAPGRADHLRAELGLPPDALVVLSAAAVKRAHKRVDHLIHEFARLRTVAPNLPTYLVVAGAWEADTDALITEGKQRLGDRVRFLVRFPRQRMPELYRAADVFVLASLFEMMPIAVIEATASGLPCLIHPHPVLAWMTGPGGQAVDMAGAGKMAAALGRLLTDLAGIKATGDAAREHCLAHFSRDTVVNQILGFYQRVTRTGEKASCA